MDRCLDLADGSSLFATCTSNSQLSNVYDDDECGGTVIETNTQTDGDCFKVVECGDMIDDGGAANDPTSAPTKAPTSADCNGVVPSNGGDAQLPLDVCLNNII